MSQGLSVMRDNREKNCRPPVLSDLNKAPIEEQMLFMANPRWWTINCHHGAPTAVG